MQANDWHMLVNVFLSEDPSVYVAALDDFWSIYFGLSSEFVK